MKRRSLLIATTLPLVGAGSSIAAAADTPLAERLRAGGVALLLRHSITDPGIGDPPGFRLDTCATQRNLSAEGRALATQIGAWFKSRGLQPAAVRSSAWCRCVDTGTLAFGRADVWAPLNSFFGEADAQQRQTEALRAALPRIARGQFEVWVTHQVNITALTNENVAMGEGWLVDGAEGRARVGPRWRVAGV